MRVLDCAVVQSTIVVISLSSRIRARVACLFFTKEILEIVPIPYELCS